VEAAHITSANVNKVLIYKVLAVFAASSGNVLQTVSFCKLIEQVAIQTIFFVSSRSSL